MKVLTFEYLCRSCRATFVAGEEVNPLDYEQSRIMAGEGVYPMNRRFFAEHTCSGNGPPETRGRTGIGDLINYKIEE